MAKAEDGTLIDPFGGQSDLEARVLRHVSEAFAEDPVRILRLARFAARFGFDVAPDTMTLMRRMVECGEADYLVPERVWQNSRAASPSLIPSSCSTSSSAQACLASSFPSSRAGRAAMAARLRCATRT